MTTVTINPSASNHDARQAAGPVTLTGAVTIVGGSQWGGLLLPGVSVPAGATINSATLYYKATSTDHDDPAINWYAQNADTAAVFVTTDNDIVDRPRTTTFVADSASAIGTSAYRSVNITPLIAAVTSRAGWASGNNIALIADGLTGVDLWIPSYDNGSNVWYVEIDYTANQFTREIAASSDDGAETTGGSMVLATTTMDCDGVGDIMGFMFRAVTVPVGATVTTAYLKLYTNDSGRDSPNVTIKGQYAPAAFGTGSTNFSSRTLTTANVSWVATDIGIGAYKNSPDIAAVLQEVVDNGGWTGSGDVAFFLIQNSSSGWLRVASFDHATDPAPQLYVEWSEGGSPQTVTLNTLTGVSSAVALTVAPGVATIALDTLSSALSAVSLTVVPGAATVELDTLTATLTAVNLPPTEGSFSLDIAAGGDDGRQELTDSEVELVGTAVGVLSTGYIGGLLFRGVNIPPGATVTSAYITLIPLTYDDPNFTIRGEFNPADFAETPNNFGSRTKTTAGVSWVASDIGLEAYEASPDISPVLQELIDTEGWATGDDLALFLIHTGGAGSFAFAAYENTTYGPPQLVVEWTLNPSNDLTIPLASLSGALAAVSLVVAPGEVSQLLDTLGAALGHEALDVAPGAVGIDVDTLNAALSAVSLVVTPGVVGLELDTLSMASSAVSLAVVPGAVAILLDTHDATLQVIALSIQGDASYIALNTLTGAVTAVSLTVVPGEVVAALNTFIGLLQVMDVTIEQGLVMSTLSAALGVQSLTVVPGEYVAALATLAPALSAVNLSVAPGAVSVDLDTLNALLTLIAAIDTPDAVDVTIVLSSLMAALSVTDLGAIPGDMVIELQTMAAHMTLYDLIVFLMLGYAMHGTRAMSGVTLTDYAPLFIRVGDTEGRD